MTTAQTNLKQVSDYIYARYVAGTHNKATDACLIAQLVYWEMRVRDEANDRLRAAFLHLVGA